MNERRNLRLALCALLVGAPLLVLVGVRSSLAAQPGWPGAFEKGGKAEKPPGGGYDQARGAKDAVPPGPARGKAFRKGAPVERTAALKNRARWGSLPVERRREIQRLYEELTRRLSAEERNLLVEKLASLDAETRKKLLIAARKQLTADPIERASFELRREILQAKLKALRPAERDLLRSMAPEERVRYLKETARERRKMLLARLEPTERARIEVLPPREQTQELWKSLGRETLRNTFRDPLEIEALRKLPASTLAKLCRAPGPPAARPAGVSEEAWKRWTALKPYERARCAKLILEGSEGHPAEPTGPRAQK